MSPAAQERAGIAWRKISAWHNADFPKKQNV